MGADHQRHDTIRKAGGLAALYISGAYLAAIPYFLVFVNYPSVTDPLRKVEMLRDHYASLYVMHMLSFQLVAFALIVVTLALHERLSAQAPATALVAAVVGFVWAALLMASVMVFNFGMGAVVRLYATDPARAVANWQVLEPVAHALGGTGGEVLGGAWVLLISVAALRTNALPVSLSGLGLAIGVAGVLSVVPPWNGLGVVFGLLQIPWFAGLGVLMLRRGAGAARADRRITAPRTHARRVADPARRGER